jgi:D-alanyl-D-alanine-carboxypeptidase/D-alanyl-D-alanine-endopeptidase
MRGPVDRRSILWGAAAASMLCAGVRAMPLSEVDLAAILRHRVDVEKRSMGMAAAIISQRNYRVDCYGRERSADDRKVSGETLFEIGSITKIYTALLLTDMARDGLLAIDDPADKYLPQELKLPERDGRRISLADLATHTAGLPRFPPMKGPIFEAMHSYSLTDLKSWLADFKLPGTPGFGWEYSNLGYCLLALALSHRAQRSYEELLTQRIFNPIGLTSTFLQPPAGTRLAEDHDAKLNPMPSWDGGIFAPAGGLWASAGDLARFVQAVMPGSGSPLEPSARLLLQTSRPAQPAGGQQALGWEVLAAQEGDYVSKDGVVGGQCATAVFDPVARVGVVVLSNTAPQFTVAYTSPSGGGVGAADIARHVLRPSIALGSEQATR